MQSETASVFICYIDKLAPSTISFKSNLSTEVISDDNKNACIPESDETKI